MKEFTFEAWCNFGKGDTGETWVDVELTDEEAEQLVKYGTQTEIYYNDFCRCEELKDLYNKIYNIAVEQITDELKEVDEEYANDPNWKADDLFPIVVEFPSEFEDLLPEE
jgi:hypothetical protein